MNNVVQTGYLTEDAKITPPKGNTSKMATFSMGDHARFQMRQIFLICRMGTLRDYIEKGLSDGRVP